MSKQYRHSGDISVMNVLVGGNVPTDEHKKLPYTPSEKDWSAHRLGYRHVKSSALLLGQQSVFGVGKTGNIMFAIDSYT